MMENGKQSREAEFSQHESDPAKISREEAQRLAEIGNDLVEKALNLQKLKDIP